MKILEDFSVDRICLCSFYCTDLVHHHGATLDAFAPSHSLHSGKFCKSNWTSINAEKYFPLALTFLLLLFFPYYSFKYSLWRLQATVLSVEDINVP